MRYFFISDVHSYFDKMMRALAEAGFDESKDTLVSVGDLFDRGEDAQKCLDYILGLQNKIILWGNHDLQLRKILTSGEWNRYDVSNGTIDTIHQLSGTTNTYDGIIRLNNLGVPEDEQTENTGKLENYFSQCVYALEFSDLIVTHGWLPNTGNDYTHAKLIKDWREQKEKVWYWATWSNTEECIYDRAFPEKDLLVGHWHSWRIARMVGDQRESEEFSLERGAHYIDCSTYVYVDKDHYALPDSTDHKVILIDGCTGYDNGGRVNVYVKETDETPTKIDSINHMEKFPRSVRSKAKDK